MFKSRTVYTSSECCAFLKPMLMEYLEDYPNVALFLRRDSSFANPDMFDRLETNGTSYAIRFKVNGTLTKMAASLEKEWDEITTDNKVNYAPIV